MYGDKATELIRHISRDHGEIIPQYQHELVEQVLRENDELYAENLRTSQSIPEEKDILGEPSTSSATQVTTETPDLTATLTTATPTTIPVTDPEASSDPTNVGLRQLNMSDTPMSSLKDNGKTDDGGGDTDAGAKEDIDIGEKELMVMQVRHTAKLWNKRCIIAYHYERLNRLKKLRWDYGNNLPHEIVEKLSKAELEWFMTYNDNLFSYMKALNGGEGLDLTLYSAPPKKLYVQVKCMKDYGQFDLEDGRPIMLKKDHIYFLQLSQCEKLIHQGVLEQTTM